MKKRSWISLLFTLVMLLFVAFIVWYLPAVHEITFQIQDVQKSLETSQGRERKQQREYDETAAAIPEIQAELDRIIPQSESAKQEAQSLKEERKKLRKEKDELEKQLDSSDSKEDD